MVTANQPENIDKYVCENNEVKLTICLYDKLTGEFKGSRIQLAYIILRGDKEESFFSYRVNSKKSSVLCSVAKQRIPNGIVSTCFKKRYHEIMNEGRHNEEPSSLFFFLSSITDKKEKINVNLNPINCSLEFLDSFLFDKDFQPLLLNSSDAEKRDP